MSDTPLLPGGQHAVTSAELRALCVDNFPLSQTREGLMTNFEAILDVLTTAQVQGELWVDGSFLTEKIDPNDIDVVMRVDGEHLDAADPNERAAVQWFSLNLKALGCHSFAFATWPAGHPLHAKGQKLHDYWTNLWGHGRSGTIKGMALIRLDPTS